MLKTGGCKDQSSTSLQHLNHLGIHFMKLVVPLASQDGWVLLFDKVPFSSSLKLKDNASTRLQFMLSVVLIRDPSDSTEQAVASP